MRFPGPSVIQFGFALAVGMVNSVTLPAVKPLMLANLFCAGSAKYRLLSTPRTRAVALVAGVTAYSLIEPLDVMRPSFATLFSVNHNAPSAPCTIAVGPAFGVSVGISVTVFVC